jgi:outer membrane receptor protein involved in Fe transport
LAWRRKDLNGWAAEVGAEVAVNRLDSQVDLFALQANGSQIRTDLPIDHAVIEERRAEGFANLGRAWTPKLRMDLGLRYEMSRQTVRGDAVADRRLSDLKPSVAFDWRLADGWRMQVSAKRTVAQLNFEDFISAAELSNERVNGGNANLVPQRAWETLLTVERRVLTDGLMRVELGRDWISRLQDRIPTPEGFDAPGNLGDGARRIARVQGDFPLSKFGIRGGRVSGRFTYQDTSVLDPYTLRKRRFSNTSTWVSDVNLRQDLGKLAWGVTASWTSNDRIVFRRNELDRSYAGADVQAFGEYRPSARATWRLLVDNLADTAYGRDRVFFMPDRRNPIPNSNELRRRKIHPVPSLSLKYNFG